jgi:galactose mutarotase-like enzyme
VTAIRVHSWRGEAAVTLAAGAYTATFLPECGMLGVSLTHDGDELLALPRSVADYRRGMPKGGYTGLPLNAPYANRLRERAFPIDGRAAAIPVRAASDRNGLPIHGTMHAQPFAVEVVARDDGVARLGASFRHDDESLLAAFPFVHQYGVDVELSPRGLQVHTTVSTTERVPVPVSFGWHPFLRVPGAARRNWHLRLPAHRRHRLDATLLPTARTVSQPTESRALGSRTFDDHYALGRDRRFALTGGGRVVDVRFDRGYAHAQIYVPPHDMAGWLTTDFICIEPMTAPINALIDGGYPTATRSRPFTATFSIRARHGGRSPRYLAARG